MRHTGSPLKGSATARSSFAPTSDRETEPLFRRPQRIRPTGAHGTTPAAFGQYATSRAILIGGCPVIGEVTVATARRLRGRSS